MSSDDYRPPLPATPAEPRRVSREHLESLGRILDELRRLYAPKRTAWTGLSAEEDRAMTLDWVRRLAPHPIEYVAEAIEEWRDSEHGAYFPNLLELSDLVHSVTRRRLAAAEQEEMGVMSTPGCDGSGWVHRLRAGDSIPCARCNPVLRMVFVDKAKWRKYLSGTPLESLDVGVTKVSGQFRADTPMPDPCRHTDRRDDGEPEVYFSPEQGRRIALAAHEAEHGPANRFVRRMLGAIGG